jgi:hypothetical protein
MGDCIERNKTKDDPGTVGVDDDDDACDPDDEECDDADDATADKRKRAKARKTTCMCGKVSKASKLFCSSCGRRK